MMDTVSKIYNNLAYHFLNQHTIWIRNGNNFGNGLVVAMRPPFKRINSFRRGASQRLSRRPASLVLAHPDVVLQCDQNGVAKCNSAEGPAVWACSLEKLLEDPLGLHTFAEFLKKEFSAENIYFWTACERFRNLPVGHEKSIEAQRIYQQHLSIGAPEAVNVDAQGRQCTKQCLQEPNSKIFDLAQKQIFNLMKFDSYPRFLKSDIYKRCLSGDIEKVPLDSRLLLHLSATPSKLKKSVSNAEDRRRKSLLPWHRKNRSKSKDRGEIEYTQKRCDTVSIKSIEIDKSEMLSGGSSLTSLDLAVTNQDNLKPAMSREDFTCHGRTTLCRVLLSNGSTTVVQIKESETIQELVNRLLEKRGLNYSSFEVYTDKHQKPLDISEPSSKLGGCEVVVEQRVVFKLDLPNRKTINIKSKYTKIIADVLRPSLHKYQYNLDQALVMNENTPIDIHLPVTSIDGMRLNVLMNDGSKKVNSVPTIRVNNIKINKLDEITNKVFEGILQEKSDSSKSKLSKSDKGSVKSEDFGSDHSSTFISKFLRRDSGVHDRKKKQVARSKCTSEVEDQNHLNKPLIAKWKSGANKLHVTCSESDELVEGLTRAQRCRLEDQRGTEINFELPDFLKDKEDAPSMQKPSRQLSEAKSNTRFYLESGNYSKPERVPVASAKNLKLHLHSNYENRNVLVNNKVYKFGSEQSSASNVNNIRTIYTDDNFVTSFSMKTDSNDKIVENVAHVRQNDPPPLPPKPKVMPIRPPNWGQFNGFYKPKDTPSDRNQAMFLEQSSSSFV